MICPACKNEIPYSGMRILFHCPVCSSKLKSAKSIFSTIINVLLWSVILFGITSAILHLGEFSWVVDSLRRAYEKNFWQFISELGFVVGMVFMGVGSTSYFMRQLVSGRKFTEIPMFYGTEYNALERSLSNIGIVAALLSFIGVVITH